MKNTNKIHLKTIIGLSTGKASEINFDTCVYVKSYFCVCVFWKANINDERFDI